MRGGQSSGFSPVPPQLGGGEGTGEVHPSTPFWSLAQKAASKCTKSRRCCLGESLAGEGQPGCGGGPQGSGLGKGDGGEGPTAGQGGVKASTAPGAGGGQAGSR